MNLGINAELPLTARGLLMKILLIVFELLFGCHHQRLSRVFTIRKRTYRVCLGCGRHFDYSWELMRGKRRPLYRECARKKNVVRNC